MSCHTVRPNKHNVRSSQSMAVQRLTPIKATIHFRSSTPLRTLLDCSRSTQFSHSLRQCSLNSHPSIPINNKWNKKHNRFVGCLFCKVSGFTPHSGRIHASAASFYATAATRGMDASTAITADADAAATTAESFPPSATCASAHRIWVGLHTVSCTLHS